MKNITYILFTLILLTSCSIKKRTYRNGYYIDWVHKGSKNTETITQKNAKKNAILFKTKIAQTITEPTNDIASTTNKISEKNLTQKKIITIKRYLWRYY